MNGWLSLLISLNFVLQVAVKCMYHFCPHPPKPVVTTENGNARLYCFNGEKQMKDPDDGSELNAVSDVAFRDRKRDCRVGGDGGYGV